MFVHRVALNAAVLPGAGIVALPGPPDTENRIVVHAL